MTEKEFNLVQTLIKRAKEKQPSKKGFAWIKLIPLAKPEEQKLMSSALLHDFISYNPHLLKS